MISQKELENLSLEFGIDKITIFREYLQILFLSYLYREKKSEKIYFKGGTCLHFLYHSPRFSEDLDFSTSLKRSSIRKLIKKIVKNIEKEISPLQLIFVYSGKRSLKYRIKYLGEELKYPLNIRIDLSFENPILRSSAAKIETKFPLFFPALILFLDKKEILTEKIRAFLSRGKGRDIFDLWYLFSEGVPLDKKVLEQKLKQNGLKFDKKLFLKKIKNYPPKKLNADLAKFLPQPYRRIIPKLKEEIADKIGLLY